MKGKVIHGNRVYLGPVFIKDASRLTKYYNESRHFLGAVARSKMTLSEEKEFIKKTNKSSDGYFFAIRLRDSHEIIGSISVNSIDFHSEHAVTGTLLGEKFTGKGYGTEAKHLLLHFIFNELKLRKVYSLVHGFNKRSFQYALTCGYIHEATLKEKTKYQDKYWDVWTLTLTKENWLSLWEQYRKKHHIHL